MAWRSHQSLLDGPPKAGVADLKFSHWVIVAGQIVGEAHSVEKLDEQQSSAFVRLFNLPEAAEQGHIPSNQLLAKEL